MSKLFFAVAAFWLSLNVFSGENAILLTAKGERLEGPISSAGGSWRIGPTTVAFKDVALLRFSPEPPPSHIDSGIFLRGGTLLTGTLTNLIGDQAEASSSALGNLKLKREDLAGAFFPLPSGQAENMPALTHYSGVLAATLGSYGAPFSPGSVCRVRFAGLDEMLAEKLMRVGSDQILLTSKNKSIETVKRQFVRMVELNAPPAAAPTPDDEKLGPEAVVRLKAGDLLLGRVVKMTDKALTLKLPSLGEKDIPRGLLAVVFLAGGGLENGSGLTWLSSIKPEKSVHTPVFDAVFPARFDATVDGGDMQVLGQPLERGIGVHSKSELVFKLDGKPRKFFTVCGIDAETNGRGGVTARVLADGKEVWKSGEVTAKDAAKMVSVDLGPAKALTLEVDYGADGDDSGDHFDWGWAAVIKN